MAVTDLTGMSDLPWWARQGGPMGTPSAAPQGAGGGGGPQPPAGVDPQAWLQYLQNMFVSPSASQANPHGDGPPDQPLQLASAVQNQPRPPMRAPPQPPYNPLAGGSANTGQAPPGPPGPPTGAPPQPLYNPLAGGSANTGQPPVAAAPPTSMPWRGPIAGDSPANIAAAGGGTPAPAAAPPGPMAANPRFVTIDQPNIGPGGSRDGRGAPQMGAINLAGLFGRGQPPAAPAPVPGPLAANARPDARRWPRLYG